MARAPRPPDPTADAPRDAPDAAPAGDASDLAPARPRVVTPLQAQYDAIKAQHPGQLLLFRMGDFYEMFGDDAVLGSRVLGIALTTRGPRADGGEGGEPLAGIPYHALDQYLGRLIRAGLKVAICEQVEDPKKATGKIVRREVVRVVTPGTVTEDALLDARAPNHIAAIFGTRGGGIDGFRGEYGAAGGGAAPVLGGGGEPRAEEVWGLAAADLSTGAFFVVEFAGARARELLRDELGRVQPAELLLPEGFPVAPARLAPPDLGATVTALPGDEFGARLAHERLCRQFGVRDLAGFGAEGLRHAQRAAGALLAYLEATQFQALAHFAELRVLTPGDAMLIDTTTQRSLELVEPLHHAARDAAARRATLLGVLDATVTGMGARVLREWLVRPLRRREKIEARLDAVEALVHDRVARGQLRAALEEVHDLERIAARLAAAVASPRDLVALRRSLRILPVLHGLLIAPAERSSLLAVLRDPLAPLPDLLDLLDRGLADQPPPGLKEGGLIRAGFDARLDELHALSRDSKEWIARFRAEEAERIGVPGLKIGFNRVFGYYIEVTRAQLRGVELPADYQRRQTLANAERFITTALKEKEDVILHAQERAFELEEALFLELRAAAARQLRRLQAVGAAAGTLDALLALAHVAVERRYVRPALNDDGRLEIDAGRHPVLEAIQPDPRQPFVPNDARLDRTRRQLALITGPNMAGKSTYIRQVALIALLAHVGSFVPAARADVGLLDRIFTRVGAMDQLARGQSTFLVEMTETANILNNCTDRSLVILDEIGRGTSTYDGLSIAWAVVEHLHNTPGAGALTLFATHYHELTALEDHLERVHNLNVAVHEDDDAGTITFLYRIVAGSTDRSYGIHAARLAGMPRATVARARELLAHLERGQAVEVRGPGALAAPRTPGGGSGSGAAAGTPAGGGAIQLTLFDGLAPHPVLERLRALDPNTLTPLEALRLLDELRRDAAE